jgi:hypothetical protein
MNRCNDCLYGLEHRRSQWHCHNPIVNRERPSFLAGNAESAATCFSERQNVVGRCGRFGKLFIDRGPTEARPRAPIDGLDI